MTTRVLIVVGKIIATAILILGIIHDIATFTPLIRDGLICLSLKDLNAVVYLSLICGSSFILCGFLLLVLLNKIDQYYFLILPIIVIGVFLLLCGLLSIVYMKDNPFAWIALILNLCMFGITITLKVNYNNYELRTNKE